MKKKIIITKKWGHIWYSKGRGHKKKSRMKVYWVPKKTKYRRVFKGKGKVPNITYRKGTIDLRFGTIGLKVLLNGHINAKQLESARRKVSKISRKTEKLWIRIFLDYAVSRKPNETRMGKGKGAFDHWIHKLQAGRVIFELSGVPFKIALKYLTSAAKKLPVPSIIVIKN